MSYVVNGQVVERTVEPRFRIVVCLNSEGEAHPGDIEWIDEPPMDVYSLTGYMQQAIDAWQRSQSTST